MYNGIRTYIKRSVKSFFLGIVRRYLTDHNRRIFFITSLYLRLANIKQVDDAMLRNINDLFEVADNVEAMIFPAKWHMFIWGEDLIGSINIMMDRYRNNLDTLDHICDSTIESIPRWMWYNRRSDMIKDLRGILVNLPPQALAS
jgi:hypothetical protein